MDPNHLIVTTILFSVLTSCTDQAQYICKNHHDDVLTKILNEKYIGKGLKTQINKKGELCHIKNYKVDTETIIHEVNSYYRSIAGILTTAKEKELVLQWVTSEKIRYKFTKTKNEIFVVIYSLNKKEFKSNKKKLDEIFMQAKTAL